MEEIPCKLALWDCTTDAGLVEELEICWSIDKKKKKSELELTRQNANKKKGIW